MYGSREGQMMVRWSGKAQVRLKSQKYSELDIGGRETSVSVEFLYIQFWFL